MENFIIGTLSFAFSAVFVALYLIRYQILRISSWAKRTEGPKDRVGFFILLTGVFGFVVGSLAQPLWNQAQVCKSQAKPVIACVVFSNTDFIKP